MATHITKPTQKNPPARRSGSFCAKQVAQNSHRLQFREPRDMQTIVFIDNPQQARTFHPRKTQQVHRLVAQTHQQWKQMRFARFHKMRMLWTQQGETATLQVEISTLGHRLGLLRKREIGIETQKTGELQQKHEMKVGEITGTSIQPFHTVNDISKEPTRILLLTHGIRQKLCQEKRNGCLVYI